MMTHSHARLTRIFNARHLCGLVASLAILGSSATALADQNGRRERGAPAVQAQSGQNDRAHQRGRSHDNRRQDNRGHDNRGHDNRGHDNRGHDNRGHDNRGHGSGHHGGGFHHNGGSIEIVIGGSIGHGGSYCAPAYRPAPRPSWAQLEYQRGFADAQCAGFEAGKSDVLCWRPFCDSPNVCFDRVSAHYRAGYLAAYACAYKEGYIAGECERQTVRLRYGNHSVRYGSCRY